MSKYMYKKTLTYVSEIYRLKVVLAILVLFTLSGCGHLIAPYNETAYQNATNIKVDSLAVMDKATGQYSDNVQEVQTLMIKVDQAYEFAKGLPKNGIVTKQWEIMIDPNGNMLWQPSLAAGQPSTLLGYPMSEMPDMPDMATDSLSMAFADMAAAYQIVDRQGTRVLRDPYTAKPYVKFYTTRRVGGDVLNFEAIKLLEFTA